MSQLSPRLALCDLALAAVRAETGGKPAAPDPRVLRQTAQKLLAAEFGPEAAGAMFDDRVRQYKALLAKNEDGK